MSRVIFGTCNICHVQKEFTLESIHFKKNDGHHFSYVCPSCSGKPFCSLCDNENCPLYRCVVCKKDDQRVCEKCNDRNNNSESWKCAKCKNKRTEREEYVDLCFRIHELSSLHDCAGEMKKWEDGLKVKTERVTVLEKELETAKSDLSSFTKQITEYRIRHKERHAVIKSLNMQAVSLYKKIKK